MILALCDRFKVLPSQLLAESSDLLRYIRIEAYGKNPTGEEV